MSIESTLEERGNRYGSFAHHARIAQKLQRVLHDEDGWLLLADDQRQALTVIMDKISRMLNGDPTYRDNWHDIVGYAKLVDDRMAADEAELKAAIPEFDEERADIIGQNGNDGEHYIKPTPTFIFNRCMVCGNENGHGGLICPAMRAHA